MMHCEQTTEIDVLPYLVSLVEQRTKLYDTLFSNNSY